MLQHRDAVGKSFVKGMDIGIARQHEAAVHAVEQRVRCFMGDNIMRKACEYPSPRQLFAGLSSAALK